MANFDRAVEVLLRHEGGYVNNVRDPGGATNFGVSLRFLRNQSLINADYDKDGDLDENDIRLMNQRQASDIYRKMFWDKCGVSYINSQAVANMAFGLCVNMGPSPAIKLLQRAANMLAGHGLLLVDGELGPKSVQMINALQPYDLLAKYKEAAIGYYEDLVERNPSLKVFLKGWLNRINSYE